MSAPPLPARAQLAVAVTRAVNAVSRRLGTGSGTVAGGRAGLAIDADLLRRLAAGRSVALVSGTNGKTTTTHLLAAAVASSGGRVATNETGSNMREGLVTALAGAPPGAPAVLEVDEGYLPSVVEAVDPAAIVLLNLSRDQLDRSNEVRMVASRWRLALSAAGRGSPTRGTPTRGTPTRGSPTRVVANADDPLVAWAAQAASDVVWVAAGMAWRADAAGCPACEGRIVYADDGGWSCDCGYRRPTPDVWLEGDMVAFGDGRRVPMSLRLPGRFNRANAAMAAAAAEAMGVGATDALAAMGAVAEVAGRFGRTRIGGVPTRLMLAKNPAGWGELLDLVCPGTTPVVVGINARIADGKDPSWLWDVAFERLDGRPVVATGERCLDLAVRLRYAGVAHETVPDPVEAVAAAARAQQQAAPGNGQPPADPATVEFIGNYTAFHDLLARR